MTDHTGLDDRYRDDDGRIHEKRGDTLVATLRKIYGPAFAKGYPDSMRLDDLLKKEGVESLRQLLKKHR